MRAFPPNLKECSEGPSGLRDGTLTPTGAPTLGDAGSEMCQAVPDPLGSCCALSLGWRSHPAWALSSSETTQDIPVVKPLGPRPSSESCTPASPHTRLGLGCSLS